jgi:hypothetical protein
LLRSLITEALDGQMNALTRGSNRLIGMTLEDH